MAKQASKEQRRKEKKKAMATSVASEAARRKRQATAKPAFESVDDLYRGFIGDYTQLAGVVFQLEQFATQRRAAVCKLIESNPSKYQTLKVAAYTDYCDRLSELKEAVKKVATFIGETEDAPTKRERMVFINDNLPLLYKAQVEFERASMDLQDLDTRFQQELTKLTALDTPDQNTESSTDTPSPDTQVDDTSTGSHTVAVTPIFPGSPADLTA